MSTQISAFLKSVFGVISLFFVLDTSIYSLSENGLVLCSGTNNSQAPIHRSASVPLKRGANLQSDLIPPKRVSGQEFSDSISSLGKEKQEDRSYQVHGYSIPELCEISPEDVEKVQRPINDSQENSCQVPVRSGYFNPNLYRISKKDMEIFQRPINNRQKNSCQVPVRSGYFNSKLHGISSEDMEIFQKSINNLIEVMRRNPSSCGDFANAFVFVGESLKKTRFSIKF